MPHKTTFDAAIATKASQFAMGSGAVGATASVFSVDWVSYIGVSTALIAFAVQMFFNWRQWQRNRKEEARRDKEETRREAEHLAYLEALREGRITPPRGTNHDR